MLDPWLQHTIFTNLYLEKAVIETPTFLKSGDGSNALKSDIVNVRARTATVGNWLEEAYSR